MTQSIFTRRLEIKQVQFEEVQGKTSIFTYQSPFFYDLQIQSEKGDAGWKIFFNKSQFNPPFEKHKEELIFEQYKIHSIFYFVFLKENTTKIGWICLEHIKWNNTTRLWDIDVDDRYRHLGFGSEMMEFIKQVSKESGSRGIVLECQTSNYPAIQFYRKMGFQLGGFDAIAYSNQDSEKHEVRLEMVFTF